MIVEFPFILIVLSTAFLCARNIFTERNETHVRFELCTIGLLLIALDCALLPTWVWVMAGAFLVALACDAVRFVWGIFSLIRDMLKPYVY